MADTAIPIGELSRRTGCNIETIRYYERIGLMPAPPRRGRYRSYGADDVGRLGFVRRARELGFTLDEVRALLGLAGGGHASCAEVRNLAASHLKDVRTRIADLKRMERVLAVPMLMVGVTVADILADPERPGPLTWWALGVAGAAIVLYLAFPGRGEDRT